MARTVTTARKAPAPAPNNATAPKNNNTGAPAAPPAPTVIEPRLVASDQTEAIARSWDGVEAASRPRAVKSIYAASITKVLKQVHPDTGITPEALFILDDMVHDSIHRIAAAAASCKTGESSAYSKVKADGDDAPVFSIKHKRTVGGEEEYLVEGEDDDPLDSTWVKKSDLVSIAAGGAALVAAFDRLYEPAVAGTVARSAPTQPPAVGGAPAPAVDSTKSAPESLPSPAATAKVSTEPPPPATDAATTAVAAAGRAGRAGGLWASSALEGGRHDLGREVEVLTEVLDAFVGQRPVEVAPRVLLVDEATGLEGLHRLDDHEVRDGLELRVLGSVEVLFGNHHPIGEQFLVDGVPGLLRDQHDDKMFRNSLK